MERKCILPDDLVEDILSRMPVKDLLRFRCVSKGWCTLIDDFTFIRKHCQAQYSFRKLDDNMPYFVREDRMRDPMMDEFYLLYIQQGDVLTLHLTDDLKRDCKAVLPHGTDQYIIDCWGCLNGIVCLTCVHHTIPLVDDFMALWNPATREFKTLPYPYDPGLIHGNQWRINGFGFDLSSSDFKILGCYFVWKANNDCSVFQLIYSLKSNSWKRINNLPADVGGLPLPCSDGYLNGVYYWTYGYSEFPLRSVIVSFNFATEVFKVSNLPQDALSLVLESYPCQMDIALYKERLALVITHKVSEEPLCTLRIWVATQFDDFGVPLSWQHLFTIRQPTHPRKILNVNTILMNGDLQLLFSFPEGPSEEDDTGGREDYLYNHLKREFKKFDLMWGAWFRYVESLFPLSKRLVEA